MTQYVSSTAREISHGRLLRHDIEPCLVNALHDPGHERQPQNEIGYGRDEVFRHRAWMRRRLTRNRSCDGQGQPQYDVFENCDPKDQPRKPGVQDF